MLEKIKEITAESLGADAGTITEETSFKEDLGADSLLDCLLYTSPFMKTVMIFPDLMKFRFRSI